MESGHPIAHVAQDLGVHKEVLRTWVRQAEADTGKCRDRLTSAEREKDRVVAQENAGLRRANEIRKAASPYPRAGAGPEPAEAMGFIDEYRSRFGVEPICRTLGWCVSS